MPEWQLAGPRPAWHAGRWQLELIAAPRHHLVIDGQVLEPGTPLRAYTPARHGALLAALVLLGSAAVCLLRPQGAAAAALLGAAVGGLTVVLLPSWLLVGMLWGTTVSAFAEPTAAAFHVAVAVSLLHGGAWLWVGASCALCASVAARFSRRAPLPRAPGAAASRPVG